MSSPWPIGLGDERRNGQPMENSKLTFLTGEDFDAAFGWIDWRGSEQEVVDIAQSQLGDDWTLELTDDDDRAVRLPAGDRDSRTYRKPDSHCAQLKHDAYLHPA